MPDFTNLASTNFSGLQAGLAAKGAVDTARRAIQESGGVINALQDLVKGLLHVDYLKTWTHATKLFVSNDHEFAPKYGFLFHAAFDINPVLGAQIPPMAATNNTLKYGLLVKGFSLPKADIETKTLNAYNRPDIIQTKLKYQPITIKFHDDCAGVITKMWKDYVDYYYRDGTFPEESYKAPHRYSYPRPTSTWGFQPRLTSDGDRVPPMFTAIRLYSLSKRRFTEYALVNPIIKSFKFGDHNHEAQFLESEMTIEFETVLYSAGSVASKKVIGFAEIDYDTDQSPLASFAGGISGLTNLANSVQGDYNNGSYGVALARAAKGATAGLPGLVAAASPASSFDSIKTTAGALFPSTPDPKKIATGL